MDAKPFASLTAGLLARKGTARPAMRRPLISGSINPMLPVSVQDDLGWNDMGHDGHEHHEQEAHPAAPAMMAPIRAVEPVAIPVASAAPVAAAPVATLPTEARKAPVAPPVVVAQQAGLAERLATEPGDAGIEVAPAPRKAAAGKKKPTAVSAAVRAPRKSVARKPKTAFTLRLDPDRHLRLRLASTLGNRSAQQIVIEALDHFLEGQPQIEELTRRISGEKVAARS